MSCNSPNLFRGYDPKIFQSEHTKSGILGFIVWHFSRNCNFFLFYGPPIVKYVKITSLQIIRAVFIMEYVNLFLIENFEEIFVYFPWILKDIRRLTKKWGQKMIKVISWKITKLFFFAQDKTCNFKTSLTSHFELKSKTRESVEIYIYHCSKWPTLEKGG